MYRKLIVAGAAAAAIVGSGTAAMALTGSSTPSSTGSSATTSAKAAPARSAGTQAAAAHRARPVRHPGQERALRTHDYARGTVSGVSTTLIVVHTADGTSQRFSVTSATKVRLRSDGKGKPGKITDVHIGDTVLVGGVGAGTPSAGHVLDLGKR